MIIEVAVVQTPTVLEAQAGGQAKVILNYAAVASNNVNSAILRVGVEQAETLKKSLDHADQWEVHIRQS
jgi:hypothetical protein